MMQIALIGIGAGAAAALLFASVLSGSMLSILLFYLAPLPILLAGIGWSHWAALVAAIVSSVGLAAVFGPFFFLAFLVTIGLPAWWLGYLALLARPGATPDATEWYPPGRLVIWIAVIAAAIVIAAIPHFGLDETSFRASLKDGFEKVFRLQLNLPADKPLEIPGVADAGRMLDLLVAALPAAAAVLMTVTLSVNLWLAGRVALISGRLRRPWPDLAQLRLPAHASTALALAAALSFFGGLLAICAGLVAATLLIAYALLGLAVIHAVTRRFQGRYIVLAVTYTAIVTFGWPILAASLIGLADTAFDLRRRFAGPSGQTP